MADGAQVRSDPAAASRRAPASTPADGPGRAPSQEIAIESVVAAASSGDEQAWRQLVEAYSGRIFALAKSRLRSPELAEEIAQAVFARVAVALGPRAASAPSDGRSASYAERGRFEAWLFRIAMNKIRDEGRARSRKAALMDRAAEFAARAEEPPDESRPEESPATGLRLAGRPAQGPHERAPSAETAALREAMDRLGDQDREIIELRHHAQMSFKQIADLLDEPLGTLLARHHRALKKLKGIIEQNTQTHDRPHAPITPRK